MIDLNEVNWESVSIFSTNPLLLITGHGFGVIMDHNTDSFNLNAMWIADNYNFSLAALVMTNSNNAEVLLDYGAGMGTHSAQLRQMGAHVICVEPDDTCRRNLIDLGFEAHESIDSIPECSVPYIIALNVLEHIEDDREAVKLLHKKLIPGGRLFIFVPAFKVLFSSMDRKVGHVRRYSRTKLTGLLTETGFTIEKAHYYDCLGFFATLLFKIFGNDSGDMNLTALRIFDKIIFPISRRLDILFKFFLGKNILAVAIRQEQPKG